uniref:Uncharacterized protein n=1 Tax=Pseudomonas phage RVTF4 TaxID=3236931 RepID=A0AB39CCU5_9VIRU
MTDKKLVVFDTRNAQSVILDYLTHLYTQQPLVGMVQPNKIQVLNIVQSLLAQIFESRDRNIPKDSENDWEVIQASLLFGIGPGQVLHRQVKYAKQVFEQELIKSLYWDLTQQADAHSTLSSYIQWEVINTGSTIVAIERGDARLLQWKEIQDAQGETHHRLNLNRVFDEFKEEFEKTHGPYPASQLDAMILKGVLDMFPQLRIRNKVEQVNYEIAAAYNIPDLPLWLDAYMKKVLEAFCIPAFAVYIPAGVTYDCEYFNHILVVKEMKEDELVEETDSDKELALALMRGDYLPREDRERAERYILDNQM